MLLLLLTLNIFGAAAASAETAMERRELRRGFHGKQLVCGMQSCRAYDNCDDALANMGDQYTNYDFLKPCPSGFRQLHGYFWCGKKNYQFGIQTFDTYARRCFEGTTTTHEPYGPQGIAFSQKSAAGGTEGEVELAERLYGNPHPYGSCCYIKYRYSVIPGVYWDNPPHYIQRKWDDMGCNDKVSQCAALEGKNKDKEEAENHSVGWEFYTEETSTVAVAQQSSNVDTIVNIFAVVGFGVLAFGAFRHFTKA